MNAIVAALKNAKTPRPFFMAEEIMPILIAAGFRVIGPEDDLTEEISDLLALPTIEGVTLPRRLARGLLASIALNTKPPEQRFEQLVAFVEFIDEWDRARRGPNTTLALRLEARFYEELDKVRAS